MKKGVILIVFVMILASFFVLANGDNSNSGSDDGSEDSLKSGIKSQSDDDNGAKSGYEYELRERHELSENEQGEIIRERNELRIRDRLNQSECPNDCSCGGSAIKCEFYDPENNQTRKELTIMAGNSNNTILQIKEYNASTRVQLYKSDDGKIYGQFMNNQTREIILPDEAVLRAESRLRERVHIENENITLDENGEYQIEARKRARLFWAIPVEEKIQFNVDSETGEVLKTRTSWWGFLARDVRTESQ